MSKTKSFFKYYGVAIVVFTLLFASLFFVFYTSHCYRELEEKNEYLLVELGDRKKNESNALIELHRVSGLLAEKESQYDTLYAEKEKAIQELQIAIDTAKELATENEYYSEVSEYVYNGEWSYEYDESDVEILAGVMYAENYISGRYEMMLTGSVVLNRVLDKRFPNNIHDVVYQIDSGYEQYAPRTKRLIGSGEVPEECYELARILLKHGSILPHDVVYQAHFKQGKGVFWEWKGEFFCYG